MKNSLSISHTVTEMSLLQLLDSGQEIIIEEISTVDTAYKAEVNSRDFWPYRV